MAHCRDGDTTGSPDTLTSDDRATGPIPAVFRAAIAANPAGQS